MNFRKAKQMMLAMGGLLVGIFFLSSFSDGESKFFAISKNIEIMANLYRSVNNSYVDNIEPAQLMRIGIDSMLKSLDPYTNYITESQVENARLQQNESNADIGVELVKKGDYVFVQDVFEDLAAYKAGIKAGDKIIAVNGYNALKRSVDDVKQILKGQPGSELRLTIGRPDQADQSIAVVRDRTEPKSVPYFGMIDDKTGYVKLNIFSANCSGELKKAIETLKDEHKMQNLVFDLRHNGGGLLNEAINIVNLFVPKGQLVVSTKGRTDEWNKEYKTNNEPLIPDMPVAVLVDERSASASEIVSGTLQDLDRGVIIGVRSFGKGLVQQTKPIGYNAQLKLTVAKYYTPSGRCVQAIDYYGTYKDGATSVPDSLRKQFKTHNGRPVWDGSGVEPDVLIEKEPLSNIAKSLQDSLLIFDFVTQYFYKNPTINPAKEFVFNDTDFESFVAYLKDKKYNYPVKSEETLKKLHELVEKEKYDDARASLAALENKLTAEKNKDLYRHKEELKNIIRQEIAARYYYQKGRVEAGLSNDPNVKKALDLFADPVAYNKLLNTGGSEGSSKNTKDKKKK